MRVLLDQNLSASLVGRLADLLPESAHVSEFGLAEADDEQVWKFARDHGYTILSKDSDFQQRSFVYGAPPKVIWIRLGNCTTRDIETVLRRHAAAIAAFEQDVSQAMLVLSR